MYRLRKSLVYFLIFAVIASLVAYRLVVVGWEKTYEVYALDTYQ